MEENTKTKTAAEIAEDLKDFAREREIDQDLARTRVQDDDPADYWKK
jgi:hypothetical protein